MEQRSKRLLVATALVACVLGVLAAAAWAWDRSHAGEIAEGVEIGGVDVSGLNREQALSRLRANLVQPLRKPIVARGGEEKFRIEPGRLGIRADLQATVEQALEASREGSLPTRLVRYVTGGEVERSIEPRVRYDRSALTEFAAEISAALNREAQDATVTPSPSTLAIVPESDGLAVEEEKLSNRLEAAVQSPDQRRVKVPVARVEPSVTRDSLAANHPIYITVDRGGYRLHLWENLELAKTYTIAVGAAGHDTPTGLYSIQNKAVNPAWHVPDSDWAGDLAGEVIPPDSPKNPIKARWLGIYNGVGVHGTSDVGSLGSAASKGCLRMDVPDVVELYDRVPVGTPIYIG